jgi:hypothetical protein
MNDLINHSDYLHIGTVQLDLSDFELAEIHS